MNKHTLLKLSIRLVLAWLLLSVAGVTLGSQITSLLLPFFSVVVHSISPIYENSLQIINYQGSTMIEITARLLHPVNVTDSLVIPPGKSLTASIHVMHVLVPMIILYTFLFAWPVRKLQERLQLLLLGIPVNIIILGLTIPALLAGHIEMQLLSMIHAGGGQPVSPFLLKWVVFVEMGGLWLFPIIGAIACGAMSRGINHLRNDFNRIGTSQSKNNRGRKKIRVKV